MNRAEILNELRKVLGSLRPDIDVEHTGEEARLSEDLGMDSITMLLMVLQLEKVFGIRFDNLKPTDFATVGDVCTYIEGKL